MLFNSIKEVVFLLIALHVLGSEAVLRRFNFTLHKDSRSPDGFTRDVYLINGQQPGPSIEVDEGDDVEVFVQNDLSVETTLHWHGLLQRGTPHMDGVPGVTQRPIPSGGNFTYTFSTKGEYGFYWYHSHFKAYYNDALRGPLVVRPSPTRNRPFGGLAGTSSESTQKPQLLDAEKNAASILLNDWTHEPADTIYARYIATGAFPSCVDSILANGLGRVQCLPQSMLDAGPGLGIRSGHPSSNSPSSREPSPAGRKSTRDHQNIFDGLDMHEMPMQAPPFPPSVSSIHPSSSISAKVSEMKGLGPRGCMPPMMFKPGFNQSSLPAETCTSTTSTLLVVSADRSRGWLALNLVNAGAVSALRVSLDAHSMFIYAADGLYVRLQEVKVLHMELGQRYSVMIKLDQKPAEYFLRFATYPSGDMQQVLEGRAIISYTATSNPPGNVMDDEASTWMFPNGSAKAGATLLNSRALAPFDSTSPPLSAKADKTINLSVNQTDVVTWVFDQEPFTEPDVPILYGNISSGWKASTTMHLPLNATIDMIVNVSNQSMDTMGHPLHLHGHKFWVLGSGTGSFPYSNVEEAPDGVLNLRDPPFRDTTGLPAQGWTVIRFVTDNPGAWIFHCHLQWHIVSGMALVFVEGGDALPALLNAYREKGQVKENPAVNLAAGRCGILCAMAAAISGTVAAMW
ncbi:hypothetical protein C2857_007180 [Epichloe festucae Fl1]|uniref:Uncharacterized protein n=1 Tax=Epichloe festucae (strain Fl1) TaxID=877507 RepID=A0A7S9KQK8_EPIFF|nr:hypothetical protein C2857_007180 [Epichloe festucae Fl1]